MKNQRPVILHIHIPKTAGSSLNKALSDAISEPKYAYTVQTKDKFLRSPENERHRINLVFGHFVYGFHKYLRPNYLNLIIAREPISRIYSYYRYVSSVDHHPLYPKTHNLNFGEFIDFSLVSESVKKDIDNAQVQRSSGFERLEENNKDAAFREACKNVLKPTTIVGIKEEYQKFLKLLHVRRILPSANENKINVNKKPPEDYKLNDMQEALLGKYTKWDELFYQHCKLVFQSYSLNHHQDMASSAKIANAR